MIHITKGSEPHSLTEYKKQEGAYYDGYPKKQDVREALLKEQGHLCAYCMRRIVIGDMKIEHWNPQSGIDDSLALDYRNMLGVCSGKIGGSSETICDTHRGNTIITVNPLQKRTVEKIKYEVHTGRIYSDDDDINKDLNQTLNLNMKRLQENRKAALDGCKKVLTTIQGSGNWKKHNLQKMISKYNALDEEGKKQEYCGIVLWYLEKRILK